MKPACSASSITLPLDFTYVNEKLSHYNIIDFLCISNSLLDCVDKYNVLNLAVNHSDHLPLALTFCLPLQSSIYKYIVSGYKQDDCKVSHSKDSCKDRVLRWDKGSTDLYYNMTGQLLYPIYDVLLNVVTNVVIPRSDWWNSYISSLKKQSIGSHSAWVAAGKPMTGALFDSKNKDKLRYKLAIKKI